MVDNSKDSFSFSAIGKFLGIRPSLEALKQWVHNSWSPSKPSFISRTEKGHFLFRFSSKEDRDLMVSHSPLLMDRRKLLLQSWSPSQDDASWPVVSPVWIRLKGIPYHCWSSDILLSIASSTGKPLRLDDTVASQRILSYARVLVNLDVGKPGPRLLTIEMEGEYAIEVEVLYENVPCSKCLSVGHLQAKCPYTSKPSILKTPTTSASFSKPVPLDNLQENSAPIPHNPSPCPGTTVPPTSFTVPSSSQFLSSPRNSLPPGIPDPTPSISNHSSVAQTVSISPVKQPTSLPPDNTDSHTENPIMSFPSNIIFEILDKIPAPVIAYLNPFSVLENCSLVEPTSSFQC
ncbi:hypothetical protein AAC387_Pa02g0929 [Persea americana]